MPRPKLLSPTANIRVCIDARLKAQLDAVLWSELEERVPLGNYQKFFNRLISRALSEKRLDLAPYLGTDAGAAVIHAVPEVIDALKRHLEQR